MSNYWNEPGICRNCETVDCNKSPGECENDARESEGDRKYHLMREGDD